MTADGPRPGGCLDRTALVVVVCVIALSIAFAATGGGRGLQGFGTVVALGVGYGLLGGSLRLGPQTWKRALGWAGAASAAFASLLALTMIWFPETSDSGPDGSAWMARACTALGFMALLTADAGVLGAVTLRRWPDRVVRVAALGSVAVVAVSVILTCVMESVAGWWLGVFWSSGFWIWVTAFLGTGLGAHLATPILGRLEDRRERHRRANAPDRALLTLQCPRCSLWMQLHSGVVACPGCRLPLRVEFEEPRCACGYPLHRLQGECCPECGRVIPEDQRWGRGGRAGGIGSADAAAVPPAPSDDGAGPAEPQPS